MRRDKDDRHLRIIYTRVLERSISKCVSFLSKEENSDKDKFLHFIKTIQKTVDKAQKVPLDNEYYKGLEKLWTKSCDINEDEFDLDEFRQNFTREANRLQKLKRVKNKKREKHKLSRFEDGN